MSVTATAEARALIQSLMEEHGPLMFHQSGGCCDGSAPMCYPDGELIIGDVDVLLGELEGCPFYIARDQWALWKHTRLIIDVVPGRGSGFSIEGPRGLRFLTRSEICAVVDQDREPTADEESP